MCASPCWQKNTRTCLAGLLEVNVRLRRRERPRPPPTRECERSFSHVRRHPLGVAAGATANRIAVEALIQARNEGRDVLGEGHAVLARAARWSRELRSALETWKDVSFAFESTDAPDQVVVPV